MARTYDLSDDSVVVIIGSGAGGGTLGHELSEKGIDVVCLEAGPRLDLGDIVNDWGEMGAKLSWNDKRIGTGALNPGLPAVGLQDRRRHHGALGGREPALPGA